MSYCLNLVCPQPENLPATEICSACGTAILLSGRYRSLNLLGKGGFGTTFLAIDESLPGQPTCVIKQLRPTSTTDQVLQMARDLFAREAQTLGQIGNHPQIPRLLDYFEIGQEFYLVQEYVNGLTLQQEVRESGCFTEVGVRQILSEILPLLDYIHTHQVIHRDIKPANLIRRALDRKLVLIDFGAVKNQVAAPDTEAADQTTLTAYAIGTPGFAPPEQMAMRPVYSSDLYALGITCIYLLTGKSPKEFDYDPVTGEMQWQSHVSISEHLANVLQKMLEASVRHRYQSANEVLRALDLEPYLNSLASSMNSVSGKLTSPTQPGDVREPESTVVRTAMAIRARQGNRTNQQRSGQGSGTAAGSQPRSLPAKPLSSPPAKRRPSEQSPLPPTDRLTHPVQSQLTHSAEELQIYYSKGKRNFSGYDLSQLDLSKLDFSGAIFHQANLSGAHLLGANLAQGDFGRANLCQTNFRDANLTQAYFSNANLEGADLRGADLSHAYLANANLRGTNLCGANLSGAKVSDEQLAQARTNWMTTRPNGKREIW